MITLYTKSGCANCVRLKQLFAFHNILYKEVNLDDAKLKAEFISAHPTVKSMPYFEGQSLVFGGQKADQR